MNENSKPATDDGIFDCVNFESKKQPYVYSQAPQHRNDSSFPKQQASTVLPTSSVGNSNDTQIQGNH